MLRGLSRLSQIGLLSNRVLSSSTARSARAGICSRIAASATRSGDQLFRAEVYALKENGASFGAATSTRLFSTSPPSVMDEEATFHDIADETLEELLDLTGALEYVLEDVDINLSQGVLNIDLNEMGMWVINKQTPNRQIWWSSPISGPKRFEYDEKTKKWISTRDDLEIFSLLTKEFEERTGINIS